ncbi:type 1 glutamine amidotransferase [Diaminobutyricibacter sp. McL0608]|uniref:type 1 glutamine amidotransferase n=1 Tax=Leifsonia sp. McL0608 TaxID=3143537 RepID=UPI0031F30995
MSAPVRILHLYPRELGINGDAGNVTALVKRAEWRGLEATVHHHDVGDELVTAVDIIHIGSGPLSSQRIVHEDVLRIAAALRELASSGVPLLAVAGGWQLLGHQLVTSDGETLAGAGVFPSLATLGTERHVGEVVVDSADGVLAGFENHSAATVLDAGSEPLGTVVEGFGNGADPTGRRVEGVRVGESVGTHLHGPVLPMNPVLADRMLAAALALRGEELPQPISRELSGADGFAANARRAIAQRTGARTAR